MDRTKEMLNDYQTGQYTIADLGKRYGFSTGKTYNLLRDAWCEFSRKWRHEMSAEQREKISKVHKGKKLTHEQIEQIRIRNSCDYNGLNGYGHTKPHNKGYVIAYAPKHPHAHRDGYVMLHTILMERQIGRYLKPNEVVHHINHNRSDNRMENLLLMDDHEHRSMHMKERHAKRRNDLLTA